MKNYIAKGLAHAVAVVVYVTGIAWFLFNNKKLFGDTPTFLTPLFALLLLVISATITGILVLGKPVHLYFNGMKQEAVRLLLITLAWLVVCVFILAVWLLIR